MITSSGILVVFFQGISLQAGQRTGASIRDLERTLGAVVGSVRLAHAQPWLCACSASQAKACEVALPNAQPERVGRAPHVRM
ncbi:hypothetical protein TIFTF001_033007 [Ficus carica]|uniref:Uncharacterized protein n=1 Tax=Ficus carica TaxID=3494 RepID=A0AA88E4I0_FICCA|nr:hypothetical protein TIFTF001_033007 [Ficus carica]